jgi:hypothetical protein
MPYHQKPNMRMCEQCERPYKANSQDHNSRFCPICLKGHKKLQNQRVYEAKKEKIEQGQATQAEETPKFVRRCETCVLVDGCHRNDGPCDQYARFCKNQKSIFNVWRW